MVDYWGGLMNYEGYQANKKMVGPEVCEQIQEDIICYVDSMPYVVHEDFKDKLCQIVVDNFNKKSCN